MADGIELGKAYVQIVPSAKGIKDSIAKELGGESARAGESAGQLFTGKLVGTIKTVLGTAAIGKMISDSVNAGGALQQRRISVRLRGRAAGLHERFCRRLRQEGRQGP